MKKIAFILLFAFSISTLFAQDTIFKRNNDKIVAKVLEITPSEIKYKKFNFQDGPTYVDKKSEIQIIIYSNGMKEAFEQEIPKPPININYGSTANLNYKIEDFKMYYIFQNRKISQPEMQSILLNTNDKKITMLIGEAKKARRREHIFIAAFPLAIAGIVAIQQGQRSYINNYPNTQPNSDENYYYYAVGGVCLAVAITCPIVSIYNKAKKMNCNSAAISLYNQKF